MLLCVPMLGHAPDETMDLTSKHHSQRGSTGFGSDEHRGQSALSGTDRTVSPHEAGVVVHSEEPAATAPT